MSYAFQAGGPLKADSKSYVERKADYEALGHLRNMDYLLFIEPRQQGKTSLVVRLCTLLRQEDYIFVYIDIEDFDYTNPDSWITDFCAEVAGKLEALPGYQTGHFYPHFEGWLTLARQAQQANKRIVVAIDEIGALSEMSWAKTFFIPMRKVFNERSFEPALHHLTFILAGAFHPRDFIKDTRISPFNVAQRVRLSDFSVEQVRQLIARLGLSEATTTTLAEYVHYWTGGQPYLVQSLCSYLARASSPSRPDVCSAIQCLLQEDENHLPPLFDRLRADPKLLEYIQRILGGEPIKFNPSGDHVHRRLELLGLIKASADDGYCTIRNRIYARALPGLADDPGEEEEVSSIFTQGHALIIGVGDDLPNTVDDAVGLANVLKNPSHCAYPLNQVHLLTGPGATRNAVLSALDTLAKSTDSQSTVVVYFSGHGYRVTSSLGTSYYLMPYGYDVNRLHETTINGQTLTEKLQSIPAQKLVMLFDCCHAGGMRRIKAPGLQFTKSPLPPEAMRLLEGGSGRVLICSSKENEVSFAGNPYSAFTLALIEALCGIGVAEEDGYVRVSDVALHAREIVPGHTNGRQHPILHFEHADNFVLAYYAGGETQPKGLPFDGEPEVEPQPRPRTTPTYNSGPTASEVANPQMDSSYSAEIPITLENVNPVKLLEAMQAAFSGADFEILCFELGVNSANLAGPELDVKMISLIEWHQKRGFYARLVDKVLKERPHLRKRLLS
jgi:hypothetical protein